LNLWTLTCSPTHWYISHPCRSIINCLNLAFFPLLSNRLFLTSQHFPSPDVLPHQELVECSMNGGGSHKAGHTNGDCSQPPVFLAFPLRHQGTRNKNTKTRARSLTTLSLTFQEDKARSDAGVSHQGGPEDRGHRPPVVRTSRRRKGCGNDGPAPRFSPRSPSLSSDRIPDRPERPLVSQAGLPSPSGSGLLSPGGGQKEGG
jgi:hypothetical protein